MPETIEQRRERKRLDSRRWRAKHPELKRLEGKCYRATHCEAIKLKNKLWHEKNRDKERVRVRLQAARRRAKDPQKVNAGIAKWRANNLEKARAAQRKNKEANRRRTARFRAKNPQKIKVWKREYEISSPIRRTLRNLRNRLHVIIKKPSIGKVSKLIGCEPGFLIGWLEAGFQPGMTWQNYGRGGWHVDHVKPCAAFNLSDPAQQRRCFHFTNLQPLWASENMSKGNRLGSQPFEFTQFQIQ